MSDLAPSIVKNEHGNYRIMRGSAIVSVVVLMADGSGWRVQPWGSGRRRSSKSWLSPRAAFESYYRTSPWAKPLIEQLPADDYRKARVR